MGTTSEFVKLRSSKTPRVGEWNKDYFGALAKAKAEGRFIVTAWSNGDACSYCVQAEKCMMTATFKNWIAKQNAYFVFQYSGDKDKGAVLHDWIFMNGGVRQYPGFRITRYGEDGRENADYTFTGNELRDKKTGEAGAQSMIEKLDYVLAAQPEDKEDESGSDPVPPEPYKVRLNESLTVKKINAILDAIDKNDGYCPCQPKGEGTKCHCEDFVKNKKIGEPCICKIYVKKSAK